MSSQRTLQSMRKNTTYPKKKPLIKAATVKIVADGTGLSTRQVNRVIKGDSKNDVIVEAALMVEDGINDLVKAVKELVPL